MKNYYKLAVFFVGLLFTACHEITTDGVTGITYYVNLELQGDAIIVVPVGEEFVDPGVIATEGGEDVSDQVQVLGDAVDTETIGRYVIVYRAVNADGFPASVSREVLVYNPAITTDISGEYAVDLSYSHRLQFANGAIINYSDMAATYGFGDFSEYAVTLEQLAPGMFSVSDLFAGYYAEGRGYSAALYSMTGIISLNVDNTITLLNSYNSGWGDGLDALEDAAYDPATETIQWGAEYAESYSFNVKLIKND
jgi:hypothetical protein